MGELIAVLFRGLIFLFLFLMVRSLARSVLDGFRSAGSASHTSRPPVLTGGELKKDPVCGTYVSPAVSITRKDKGETVYFCSPECRDRYLGR